MVASTTKSETSFSCNLSNFPPDVLSQIFRFSIHGDIMTHWYDVEETRIPTKVDTPWPLMLVCRSWFNVVSWDAAVLWSTFAVTIRQPVASHKNLSRLPLFLEHYLQQSGEAPLTIKIVLAGGQRTNRNLAQETTLIHDVFKSLLTIAMNHCDRWRHISLRLRPGYHIQSLMEFSLPLKRMPILKSFQVENYAGWPITIEVNPHSELEALHLMGAVKPLLEEGIPRQDLAAGFPNLRRVRVVPAVTYYDQHHNFRWKILQLSPQVEEVDIFRASLGEEPNDHTPILQLKALKILRIHLPLSSHSVLEKLSLPAGVRLVMRGINVAERISSSLPSLLAPLGPSVTHLVISFVNRTAEDSRIPLSLSFVAYALRSLECLEKLTVELLPKVVDIVFHALLHLFNEERGAIPPPLKCLQIKTDAIPLLACWSLLRELVFACHKACTLEARHFTFQVDVNRERWHSKIDDERRRIIEEGLMNDVDVKDCIGGAFKIKVNDLEVMAV